MIYPARVRPRKKIARHVFSEQKTIYLIILHIRALMETLSHRMIILLRRMWEVLPRQKSTR